MSTDLPEIVVFFDGVCGLCNRFVDFVIACDKERQVRYAPLQGETFRAVALANPQLAAIDSVVVAHRAGDGSRRLLVRSRAALFVLRQLGGGWALLARVLSAVPSPVADLVYRLIARTRYRFFGRKASCRLPSAAERELFLP